jgi:hypothetical protein
MPNIYVYDGAAVTLTISSTGEITIDSFTDNLPSGTKAIIVAVHAYLNSSTGNEGTVGYFKLYRGTTVLDDEEVRTHIIAIGNVGYQGTNWHLYAVDSAPANATYTVKLNVTASSLASSWKFEVKAMVILFGYADISYGVVTNVTSGSTVTVTSKTMSLTAGKYVIAMRFHAEYPAGGAVKLVGADNVRLKIGDTTVASNEYPVSTYSTTAWVYYGFVYLHSQASDGSTSVAIEVYNDSGATLDFYGRFIIFKVSDGYFLDTSSVSVGTSQTTIANLSTGINAGTEVGVLAVTTLNNTSTNNLTFGANSVVLQQNNSTTNQVVNELGFVLKGSTSVVPKISILFPARYTPSASNPSYQTKATATGSGVYGETKIVVFSVVVVTVSVSDSGVGVDAVVVSASLSLDDSGAGVDVVSMVGSVPVVDSGSGVEYVDMVKEALDSGVGVDAVVVSASLSLDDSGAGVDVVSMAGNIPVTDFGAGVESVDMVKEILDSGVGVDYFTGGVHKAVDDSGSGVDVVSMTGSVPASDAGYGVDAVSVGASASVGDSGAGVEVASVGVLQSDGGVGADYPGVVASIPVSDGGYGVEVASLRASIPVSDYGAGVDAVVSPRLSAVADSGSGVEVSVVNIPVSDSGAGVEVITPTREVRDYGYGVDVVTEVVKGILDSGVGAEAVYVSAGVFAYDYGSGVDAVGIVGYVSVEDSGAGVDVADWFLSMYGLVFIDTDDVGLHSIPYKDWRKKNIPVQAYRRSVGDRVYVDSDDVGDVAVEWEDKVSDVVPGERTLVVTGLVEIYD